MKVYDDVIDAIARYVLEKKIESEEAYAIARLCLADTLTCGFLALKDPHCQKHLGPFVSGTTVIHGIKVPGTSFVLDPIQAAYTMGVMNRWLDYNDTWLAAEWGHPSDNLAAILAVSGYVSHKKEVKLFDVYTAMIKAHEIQGVLALKNSLNAHGFDHVLFVKVASTAVCAALLGCDYEGVASAISNAFIDVGPLRTYRHAPNTGPRKSWAAGDAASRGVFLALKASQGEEGYPSALTTPKWGFQDSILNGKPLILERALGSYVMENVLFKVRFPAEFHAQTAVEAAIQLHSKIEGKWKDIKSIHIDTHISALKIISKQGPLKNFADRDHCLEYMTAAGLIFGDLKAEYYSDQFARSHPQIDQLREKITVSEEPQFSKDYLDPNKRSIASRLRITLNSGKVLEPITVEYPLGHRRRREEGLPFLIAKIESGLEAINAPHLIKQFPFSDSLKIQNFLDLF